MKKIREDKLIEREQIKKLKSKDECEWCSKKHKGFKQKTKYWFLMTKLCTLVYSVIVGFVKIIL